VRHLPSFDQISDAQLVDMDPRRWAKDLQREIARRRQQQTDFFSDERRGGPECAGGDPAAQRPSIAGPTVGDG
jgi:hypothetical protein